MEGGQPLQAVLGPPGAEQQLAKDMGTEQC